MVKRGNNNITNNKASWFQVSSRSSREERGFTLDRHTTKRIPSSRSKFDNSRVFSLSFSLFSRPKKSNDNKHNNNNNNTLCNSSYQWPMPVICVIIVIRRITLKVSDWMNFRSIRERKKVWELYTYLRRFCTRRWPLSGTALARRSSCRRWASVRLSICPFFLLLISRCLFSLKGRERID